MKTTTKILRAAAGSLLLMAPAVASAQMAGPDSVQDEVNDPGGIATTAATEPAELVSLPDTPDEPEAVEAAEAPGLSG